MEDFSKWFHHTYEIVEEPKIISTRQIVYAYKSYCVPFYKTKKEHTKNTTHQKFIKKMKHYEPELYNKYYKKNKSGFIHIRRRDGWGEEINHECNRCNNTGYDEGGNCLECNL